MPGITVTFAFILATLCGAVFHFVAGGDARRLALYLLSGWVGFSLGHGIGVVLGVNIVNIGPLRIVTAVVGALVALIVARFFATYRAHRRPLR